MIPIVRVDPVTRQLVDEQGNTRFVRGMSVAYKTAPFLPQTDEFHPVLSFSQVDLDLFQRLNLNVIRLPVCWAAVQPQPGPEGFDQGYLDRVVDLVQRCAKVGIYVLIEAHQDLYAERFCGNGVRAKLPTAMMPAWSITSDRWTMSFPRPTAFCAANYDDPDTFPCDDTCGANSSRTRPDWGKFYASDAVTRAFWGLYTDEAVQGPFVSYWEKLAETFAPHSNVIGYELLNEPFVASKTTAGVPYNLYNRANTERKYLVPLYDRLAKAIRRHDPRTLLWWEPVTGGGGNSGEGFDRVPGIEDGGVEKSVLSFHSYGPNLADGDTMVQAVEKRVAQVAKIGGAAVLTEYDCEFDRGLGRIREVMELADEHMLSWIGWQYKEFIHVAGSPPSGTLWDPETSLLRPSMLKLFSRPFPTSITGTVESYRFDWDANVFRLVYYPRGAGWTRIGMSEDAECGWGEWLPRLEAEPGVSLAKVVVQKGWGEVLVSAGEGWAESDRLVVLLSLR